MTEEKNTGAPEQEMDLSEQRLIRRAKLKELQDAGKTPFRSPNMSSPPAALT